MNRFSFANAVAKKSTKISGLKKRQLGLTIPTIAAIVAVGAFFLLVALTLFPIYMENFSVSSHLKRMKSEAPEGSEEEIVETLLKRYDLDDVKSVTRDHILVSTEGGGTTVTVDYEVRKNFMANVDLVVVFKETASW